MAMTHEDFQNECAPHIEAMKALIEKMPFQGNTSEESQKVQLSNTLMFFDRAVDSVQPFDFVDVNPSNDDLFLKDSAEEAFNNDPSLNIYEVFVWFNEVNDTTTAVEDYVCLIAAMSPEQVEAMGEEIHQMLNVDNSLFINIDEVQLIHTGIEE